MNQSLIDKVISGHQRRFGEAPAVIAYAPGRIEVLGNHTDYNAGFVLSAAIDAGVCAAVSVGEGNHCVLSALDVGADASFDLPVEKPVQNPHWANYLIGVVNKLGAAGKIEKGFNLTFAGDVPPGAGLSSSAALEVATALALSELFNLTHGKSEKGRARRPCQAVQYKSGSPGGFALPVGSRNSYQQSNSSFDLMQIARLCQQAENEFAGARCGLLDQISSLFGAEGALVFTDFRLLTVATIPLGSDICFLLADTGVKHRLVESAYNERRAECERATGFFASALDHPVSALRDVSSEELAKYSSGLDPVAGRRAAHVIGENARVLNARRFLAEGKLKEFGELMFASHESSRVNFENSCPELDFIVAAASRLPPVLGARLSGGGFGGSAVLLVRPDAAAKVTNVLSSAYAERFGKACPVRVIKPSAGAQLVKSVKRISPARIATQSVAGG